MAQQDRGAVEATGTDPTIDAIDAQAVEVGEGDTVELDRFNGKRYVVKNAGNGRWKLWPVTLRATPSPLFVGKGALAATIADGEARVTEDTQGVETLAGDDMGRDWSAVRAMDEQRGR